ncbi:hypothetical protein ACFRCI_03535 [Streptomyces sp. NPDC056638]|uniref:hypothetical protein n=1 Tax=Streptomyces sp. NPDC056638 TaxID=3345887 RepID=UPI0036B5BB74
MNLYVSLLRTGVPAAVGWVIAQAAAIGLQLNDGAVSGVLTPIAVFAYYGLFRLAEKHVSPRFGWLLGYAKPPVYDLRPTNG